MAGVERHLLDEAHLGAVALRERDEVDELVVVDAAHRDRVELERTKTGCRSRGDSVEHVVEPVPPGEVAESLAVAACRARC